MSQVSAAAIGIDLGTTHSCVAVFQNGVKIIANEQGNRTTPSIVAFNEHERLVGETADQETIENPTNVIRDVKRLIGRDFNDSQVQANMKHWSFDVVLGSNGKPNVKVQLKGKAEIFTPEQISAMVLEKLKKIAEDFLGKPVKHAVISVPAYFNEAQRQATMDAAKIAGLNVLRIIKEPTAAAFAYGLEEKIEAERKVLIFDLGGGTFDVSILSVQGGTFEVKGYGGISNLGGEDFNNNLVEHFSQEFEKKHGQSLNNNSSARARLRMECEKLKRTLTSAISAKITIDNLLLGKNFSSTITRAKFESLNSELFRNAISEVDIALKAANLTKDHIEDIVLVGGSTRIPKIQKLLQEYFNGKQLYKLINPDEAIAYGAAIQAANLDGSYLNNPLKDFKFSDILPLSLGVEIIGGRSSVVISRNAIVPASFTQQYTTVYKDQSEVLFKLYEGERVLAKENNLLGEMTLTELQPNHPAIDVTFTIDENGTLHTKAVEKKTGKSTEAIVQYSEKRLTQDEIERMIVDAQRLKLEDERKVDNAKACNELESYCFDLQTKVKTSSDIPDNVKKAIIKECNEVLDWLKEANHDKNYCRLKSMRLENFSRNYL